tara:strand:- start:102 stop:527 length:426 start_codon:yes stop_codon:yes gene_type:complete
MVFVSFSQAKPIISLIDIIEKLELNPTKLEKGCPKWDDFTEGQHWKFGKTNNFEEKYAHMVPKNPDLYYAKGNPDYEKQLSVENQISEVTELDFTAVSSSSIILNEKQMSKIAKECDVSLKYVQDVVNLKKIGEEWLSKHQ